ncbi:hypothetical protein NUW58_g8610 [Xylaria curta]|uniref:Uncharacterized protein n=1 Tax=Xylaria curta TaxID=42375 RepID=A0ACC1N6R8_9PEZI|nr:hypothetical protein NUW58_g8610 [Xylaria curta]
MKMEAEGEVEMKGTVPFPVSLSPLSILQELDILVGTGCGVYDVSEQSDAKTKKQQIAQAEAGMAVDTDDISYYLAADRADEIVG